MKEVKECESQCEILKGSNDIPTQTDSVDEEELIKETKVFFCYINFISRTNKVVQETQSDSQERSDISIQTEMEEERIEKEHVEMIHQVQKNRLIKMKMWIKETQPEYSDRNSVEIQTELEDWKNEVDHLWFFLNSYNEWTGERTNKNIESGNGESNLLWTEAWSNQGRKGIT